MIKIYATALILFFAFQSFSQDATDRGYIGITLGPSFPTGDFGDNNSSHPKAGMALTGGFFDVSFAYRIGKKFGIAAMLRGESNAIDVDMIEADITRSVPDIKWTYTSDPWGIGLFMVGGYATFPNLTGSNAFELRLMMGSCSATFPQQHLTGSAYGLTATSYSEETTSTDFAVLFGADYRFNVSRKISLRIALDVFSSDVNFKNVKAVAIDGKQSYQSFEQNFSAINLGFGVAYRLGYE